MASSLGVSLGKANYCLRALIAKGLVKSENYRNSTNKLSYLYLLTPSGLTTKAELTRHFLARKVVEYEALRIEIERLRQDSESSGEGDVDLAEDLLQHVDLRSDRSARHVL